MTRAPLPRRLTLRRRLVIGIVALIAVVTVVIGVVSVLALESFMVGRLDTQLTAASDRSQSAIEQYRPDDGLAIRPPPGEFLALPGQGAGTLAGLDIAGQLTAAAVLDESGEPVLLEPAQLAILQGLTPGAEPVTVDLGAGLGQYRVVTFDIEGTDASILSGLPMADVQAIVLQLTLLIVGIGVIGVAATAAAGALVVRLALRPLERVASTATRVAELPLDRGEVALAERVSAEDADPRTEVGSVGAALNTLLEHVASALKARQASENKVRTFVADASHELRTPLASIRGYAELTRRGGHDLPDDVVHAIGRVESESVRMTGLVEDLLLLARLDEGTALEGADVDLTRLVIDAVGDARAAAPDHIWQLDLPDTPVTMTGDAARLHQVVANLLANARTHTPTSTTVTAAISVLDGDAIIEVRDTGPGVDPQITSTLFERFVRGDSSRSRAAGSTGLGLAIVTAVVEAHGGRAEVESTAGNTVFRVILPGARIA